MLKSAQKRAFQNIVRAGQSRFTGNAFLMLINFLSSFYPDVHSKQLTALKVLSKCLCKDKDALCYLYEEYSVSVYMTHLNFTLIIIYMFVTCIFRQW